ncbi:Gfo/Idh/MocA family protein [Streptomyces lydicus]|uniref:Gfo/Idh/MocA family protein n=1 Tax=Streptomyces lydicus TaxID=47763 RepID=UPI0036FC6623
MDRKYRAAVIGLGKQATEDHLPGVLNSQHVELTSVCDTDTEKTDRIASELGVSGYSDHRKLIEVECPDFVIVATPHNTHATIVEDAANASVHVLKEKPFATSGQEANHLADLAQRNGIEIMTTLQRRFNPIYTSFFQLADQIGDPFFLDVHYTLFVDSPHAGWRGSRANAGGGCIIDMGYHMLDLVIWYLGIPSGVVATTSSRAIGEASYDAEDTASILLRWPSGLHGSCVLSRFLAPKRESLRLVGPNGQVQVERGSIKRLTKDGTVAEHLTREGSWDAAAAAQVDYFCRVLAGERRNIGDATYHRQHAAVIDACYESVSTGSFVDPRKALAT